MVTIYTDFREEYEEIQKLKEDHCLFGKKFCKGNPQIDCKECEEKNLALHCNERW